MQQIFVDQSVKIDDTFMVEGEDARTFATGAPYAPGRAASCQHA